MTKYGENRLMSEKIKNHKNKFYVYEIGYHQVLGEYYLEETITTIFPDTNKPNSCYGEFIMYSNNRDDLIKEIERKQDVKIEIKD